MDEKKGRIGKGTIIIFIIIYLLIILVSNLADIFQKERDYRDERDAKEMEGKPVFEAQLGENILVGTKKYIVVKLKNNNDAVDLTNSTVTITYFAEALTLRKTVASISLDDMIDDTEVRYIDGVNGFMFLIPANIFECENYAMELFEASNTNQYTDIAIQLGVLLYLDCNETGAEGRYSFTIDEDGCSVVAVVDEKRLRELTKNVGYSQVSRHIFR